MCFLTHLMNSSCETANLSNRCLQSCELSMTVTKPVQSGAMSGAVGASSRRTLASAFPTISRAADASWPHTHAAISDVERILPRCAFGGRRGREAGEVCVLIIASANQFRLVSRQVGRASNIYRATEFSQDLLFFSPCLF